MISLTPAEKHLRDFLADRAAKANPDNPAASVITYGNLADELDPDNLIGWAGSHPRYGALKTALFHVSSYEAEHNRPMLTAFVVRASGSVSGSRPRKGEPGNGFFKLARRLGRLDSEGTEAESAFWESEMRACSEQWSATGAGTGAGLPDAQYDTIMAELGKIKQMLRTLLHA